MDHFTYGLVGVLLLGGGAAFGYLAVTAFTHLRLRLLLDFFRDVTRQVEKLEQLKKTGTEAPLLWKYHEVQSTLRRLLERHRLLGK